MDDFANMLLAKHQSTVEAKVEDSPQAPYEEMCTPRIVTEKEIEMIEPPTEEVKIDQFNG